MKKHFYILFLLPLIALGQNQNYVKTTTYKQPNSTSVTTPGITVASVQKTYFDGLGRPIQQVSGQQSNTGKDIITPIEYDTYGRKVKEYLPYKSSGSSQNYDSSWLTNITDYYGTPTLAITGNSSMEATSYPYSQKLLESSPLNRVFKQAAPGNAWAIGGGGGKEIKLDYQPNVANEVKLFKVTNSLDSNGLPLITLVNGTGTVFYGINQLYKTITKDENWVSGKNNTVEEFKNKDGQVVLKKTYSDYDNPVQLEVAHCTYYVYDSYGNLTYVIPPKAADVSITPTVLDALCYQYKYDYRNRLVEKKLPGKQWEFIVYDKLNRVVATGPTYSPFTNLTTSVGWMVTKYDALDRPVLTAWMPSTTITSAGRKTLQDARNSETTNFSETHYNVASNNTINGVGFRYTNSVWPTSGYHVLTINYYDDYNFTGAPTVFAATNYDNSTKKPKGLQTGTWVRALQTSTTYLNELSYTIYDYKARPIQTKTTNYLGGYDQLDSSLESFSGKLLNTLNTHKRLSTSTAITVKDEYTYSYQDRVLAHTHLITSAATPQLVYLAENSYDELGQLISKNVGRTTALPLQKVDYTYNIRGWLTGINKTEDGTSTTPLNQANDPNDLFAFKINYNTVVPCTNYTGKALFNGNISETYWRTSSDNILRKYGYSYDQLNRLKSAVYIKPTSGTYGTNNSYNENNITYDKNGNITHLERTGEYDDNNSSNVLQTDILNYSYSDNSLRIVADASNNPNGFKDDVTNDVDPDYDYDLNGNMIVDQNKGIISITYNHMNLPTRIVFGPSGLTQISYLYNAKGQKLKKVVSGPDFGTETTDYLNGYQYVDGVLKFFPTSEGYVSNTVISGVNNYNYVYNYTDHLGNIRLSYGLDQGVIKIIEENNYYPFGLKHNNYNVNKRKYEETILGVELRPCTTCPYQYKYNGQEWQDELGLNVYDMNARNYDPAIARFISIDPIVHYSHSTYTAFNNNPVYWSDPNGLSGEHYDWNTGTYVNDKNETVTFEVAMASQGLNVNGSQKTSGENNSEASTDNSEAENGDNPNIKFPKDQDYEKKYPRLTKILQQVHDYVKNNPDLLYYLAYYSGYSSMEVLEKLEYGKGVELQSWIYGKNDGDPNGWTPNTGNFITINAKYVNGLEIAKTNETIQGTSFFLMTTILHEFVHSSRVKNKLSDYPAEYGKAFEKYGFGKDINKYNANEYWKKNGWNFKY